jgi:hypothetical protein
VLYAASYNKRIYQGQQNDMLIQKKDHTLFLTFKGCSQFKDFVNSIDIRNCKIGGDTVGIHNGFCEKYKELSDNIWCEVLKNAMSDTVSNVVFTGHSAGGSIAQIASLLTGTRLQDIGMECFCFSFGAPKTGDELFKDAIEYTMGDKLLRIETLEDIVPLIPMQRTFQHAGNAMIIHEGKIVLDIPNAINAPDTFFSNYYSDYLYMINKLKEEELLSKKAVNTMINRHSSDYYFNQFSEVIRNAR